MKIKNNNHMSKMHHITNSVRWIQEYKIVKIYSKKLKKKYSKWWWNRIIIIKYKIIMLHLMVLVMVLINNQYLKDQWVGRINKYQLLPHICIFLQILSHSIVIKTGQLHLQQLEEIIWKDHNMLLSMMISHKE